MLILTTLLRRIICFWNVVRVELRDGYVISRSYWFGKWERKNKGYVVKTDAIVYFDTAMSIWGKSVSFGGFVKKEKDNNLYVNFDGVDYLQFYNMDIVGLNLNNVDKIKQYLIENGAKLVDDGGEEYKSLFPLGEFKRWFILRERIRLGKDGILYIRKRLLKSTSSYLPYDDIKIFLGTDANLWGIKMYITADVSVDTEERFSKKVYKQIETTLQKKSAVQCLKGITYKPSWLSFRSLSEMRSRLILLEDGFIVKEDNRSGFYNYSDITSVSFKKRSSLFSLFGTLTIEALRSDARTGSSVLNEGWFGVLYDTKTIFVIPGIWSWKWKFLFFFSGKLKKFFKSKAVI